MDIVFVGQNDDEVALEALEILKQKGVQVAQVSLLPDELPQEWIVLTGKNLPRRFPSGHVRIKKDEQTVFLRSNQERRAKNPVGFETAVVGIAIEFGALPPIESTRKRKRRKRSPFSRKTHPAGITEIYPE